MKVKSADEILRDRALELTERVKANYRLYLFSTRVAQLAGDIATRGISAVYEPELSFIWPKSGRREEQIQTFAREYGWRLRHYADGLVAIFGKEPPAVFSSVSHPDVKGERPKPKLFHNGQNEFNQRAKGRKQDVVVMCT